MSESPKQYPLRLPPDLHERLMSRTASSRRSLNGEIVHLLQMATDELHEIEINQLIEELRKVYRDLNIVWQEQRDLLKRREALMRSLCAESSEKFDQIMDELEPTAEHQFEAHERALAEELDPAILKSVDEWIKNHGSKAMSRPTAIRLLVEKGLEGGDKPEGFRP